jgi:uncharacterized membrane protein YeaQ/YmgE (transglycosylase-associated protein family)
LGNQAPSTLFFLIGPFFPVVRPNICPIVRPNKRPAFVQFENRRIVLSGDKEKMNMVALIIQLISGAVGGNIAGALMKNFNLGPIGNSIAGLVGGGLGGQLLGMLTSGGAASAVSAAGSGMDVSSILSSIGGGGIGGAVVMAIVGLIKTQMSKSS